MAVYKVTVERLSQWAVYLEAESEEDARKKYETYDTVIDEYEEHGISSEIKKIEVTEE